MKKNITYYCASGCETKLVFAHLTKQEYVVRTIKFSFEHALYAAEKSCAPQRGYANRLALLK